MRVSEESGIEYRKTHWILAISARILHSFPYFFITLFPTAFFLHSKMTGTYLMPFRMKSFSYLLTLAPFVSFADTFPDKRGQLEDLHSFLSYIGKAVRMLLFFHQAGTACTLHSFLLYIRQVFNSVCQTHFTSAVIFAQLKTGGDTGFLSLCRFFIINYFLLVYIALGVLHF